jgi:serine/threonine protein phosphatase PrpC
VAAAITGRRANLLVVADGHSGHESSVAAVGQVLDRIGDDPPPADLTDAQLVELFDVANTAILDASDGLRPPRGDSATTLVVVLVADGRVQWASMGDSVAMLAAPGATRMLASPMRRFVGHPTMGSLASFVSRGAVDVDRDAWVVLATDGYSDWAPTGGDLARATALWSAGSPDAATVVHRLMEKARVGGAGDNVAIVVARA